MDNNPKSLLSDLINMVMADGKIKPPEIEFIRKIAKQMNIAEMALANLFENPLPQRPVYNEVTYITHFYKLILMMNIDNETHEYEIEALKNFGLKMGIRPIVADQILKKMEQSEDNIIPADELLKIFKIYYN